MCYSIRLFYSIITERLCIGVNYFFVAIDIFICKYDTIIYGIFYPILQDFDKLIISVVRLEHKK